MLKKSIFKSVIFIIVIAIAGFVWADDYRSGDNPVVLSPLDNESPEAPTNLRATVDVYTVSLSWDFMDNEDDFDHFNIYRRVHGETSYDLIDSVAEQSYTDELIGDESVCIYRVTAVDNGDPQLESEYSNSVYTTVGAATPKNFKSVSNQDGVVHLYWDTPVTLPCTTLTYDDGSMSAAICNLNDIIVIAKEFNGIAPISIWKAHVGIITNTSNMWPFPDDHHDPIEILIYEGDGTGQPGEVIGDTIVTPILGEEWLTVEFNPPLICNTNDFYVGKRNAGGSGGNFEGVGMDEEISYPENVTCDWMWYGFWRIYDHYDLGEWCIRATIGIDGAPELITEGNSVFETENIAGYHIYRGTSPNVPIDDDHRITPDYLTETSYNDEDVNNGTTYYYTAVAVYDVDGETVESQTCEEISATPMNPGQFAIDNPSSISETGESGRDEIIVPVVLANDGDLPVSYSVTTSTEYEPMATNADNKEPLFVTLMDNKLSTVYGNPDDSFDTPVIATHNSNYFSYVALNSLYDENGPEFNWVDITEIGTRIDPEPMQEDSYSLGPFGMEFEFPFYDSLFSSFRVCTNGFISFTSDIVAGYNYELPVPDAYMGGPVDSSLQVDMIAPYWDEHMGVFAEELGLGSGEIYYYTNPESTIVSWINYQSFCFMYPDSIFKNTFQAILTADGNITLQYLNGRWNIDDFHDEGYEGDLPTAMTIGIQNSGATDGLELGFNDLRYLHNEMAVKIYRPWLRVDMSVGTIPANGTVNINAILDPVALSEGTYSSSLVFSASDMNQSLPSEEIPVTFFVEQVDIKENDPVSLPTTTSLIQNYPNPFNASTSIQFSLEKTDEVTLSIYDVLGRRINTLHTGLLSAGLHSMIWNGTGQEGDPVSSGIYFYILKTSSGSYSKQMVLLK